MMKKKGGVFAILMCMACSMHAAILVVDQDTTNQAADYQQLQPALDAAQPGDSIYVMGGATIYQEATIEKLITPIGAGVAKEVAFPAAHNLESKLGVLTVKASDVFLTGFVFTDEVFVLATSRYITFYRNHSAGFTYSRDLGGFAVEKPEVATTISNLHVINNRFSSNNPNYNQIDLYHSGLADKGIVTKQVGFVFANNIMTGARLSFPNGDGSDLMHKFYRLKGQLPISGL